MEYISPEKWKATRESCGKLRKAHEHRDDEWWRSGTLMASMQASTAGSAAASGRSRRENTRREICTCPLGAAATGMFSICRAAQNDRTQKLELEHRLVLSAAARM